MKCIVLQLSLIHILGYVGEGMLDGCSIGDVFQSPSAEQMLAAVSYTHLNKIGTSGVASLAKYYGIPFYVLGPTSTIDMSIEKGEDIHIEQRPAEEVTEMWYKKRMAPEGVKVYNPAFDFADNELIAGIVTEYGIARPPYTESLKEIFKKKAEAEAAKKK